MDLATIFGLIMGFGAVLLANWIKGGTVMDVYNLPAILMIIGGTLGATTVSFSLHDMMQLPAAIGRAFVAARREPYALIDHFVALVEKARREGLLALQDDIGAIEDPLLATGVTLVVDGTEPDAVADQLEAQIESRVHPDKVGVDMLEKAGGYSPTIGIIGAVLGLVHTLKQVEDLSKIGPSIAVAFLATFYGILFANLLWLPLAGKLRHRINQERQVGEMIITGLMALQAGEAPRTVREKLEVFAVPLAGRPPDAAQSLSARPILKGEET